MFILLKTYEYLKYSLHENIHIGRRWENKMDL